MFMIPQAPIRSIFPTSMFPPGPLATLLALAFLSLPLVAGAAEPSNADIPEQVNFSEHVAPILYENCVRCHRPGDVAPMALTSFEEIRPWAKSIAQQVSSRAMPPWDANPAYGNFSNDLSLAQHEVETIKRWVEQGAKPGDLKKAPALPAMSPPGAWQMGREPDLVIDLAEVEVWAEGPRHLRDPTRHGGHPRG